MGWDGISNKATTFPARKKMRCLQSHTDSVAPCQSGPEHLLGDFLPLYFSFDSKELPSCLSGGGRANKGHDAQAAHQISADINLWPGIWMVWCDITKWLESRATHPHPTVCAGCQRCISTAQWPCSASFHTPCYSGCFCGRSCQSKLVKKRLRKSYTENTQVCASSLVPDHPYPVL